MRTRSTVSTISVTILTVCVAFPVHADIVAGPFVYNGHLYYLADRGHFAHGEQVASQVGGHLVTIDDSSENTWVFSTFWPIAVALDVPALQKDKVVLMIGMNDVAPDDNIWTWSSGDPVHYYNWRPGQPQNNNNENAAGMFGNTGWDDFYNRETHHGDDPYGIIEVDCDCFFDFDDDCDVDAYESSVQLLCLTGPQVLPSDGCEQSDLDADGDCDLVDFAVLQQHGSGSGNPVAACLP